ncbi:MAG: DNA polymerase III, subunit gamma and tau [Candidatus Andersenbacteria bacterium RIFCSPLOWO2_12_FULL_45_8]|nr:MAG: DNA polymerase III, subunit gamma and tau [Candidatus Andersenbacteria bacterium RIFCSPLOWO2_12_FULL_45_8]
MTTLYRQYRPAIFSEVTGQKHVTDTLQAAIVRNRLTHAYLFYGPRGTGKTTTARILAKRLNCEKATGAEPCGQCESCQAMAAGRNIDVIEIDAASNRGIDDIRALRDRIASAPSMGKYKVYIVDEVHMLTPEAAAALLKTLEEPVKHAIFILATTELHKVLPTILSRCQVYRFKRASREEMMERLRLLLKQEKRQAEDGVMDFIIERSDGCYRDAESLLGQLLTLQENELKKEALMELLGLPPDSVLEDFLGAMLRGESAAALTAVDTACNGGHDPEQFLQESIRRARDKALAAIAKNSSEAGRWTAIIRALLQARQDLDYVPQPQIALHLAILTICTTQGPVQGGGRPTEKKEALLQQPQQESKSLPTSNKPAENKANQQGVEKVAKIWSQLIEAVKSKNPVAATFLRAIEPIAGSEGRVDLRARYSLHRNFFSTPRNKEMVEEALEVLLGVKTEAVFILDEASPSSGQSNSGNGKSREEQFYETVKEVFG